MQPLTERVRELEREMAEIYAAEADYFARRKPNLWQEWAHERRQERFDEILNELAAWLRRPAG
jgi:hypothetical protein